MIARGAAALTSVAAATAATVTTAHQPLVWSFLGLPFEAAAMIAALFGCTVTRVIIGQSDKSSWHVKLPVDVLAIGVTFFAVVERKPELFAALLTGIFIGTLGATIIKIAEKWGARMLQVILPSDSIAPVPPSPPAPPSPPGP